MSCSLNSKVKSGPGAETLWGSGAKPPEAGEKITPEMLRNSIFSIVYFEIFGDF